MSSTEILFEQNSGESLEGFALQGGEIMDKSSSVSLREFLGSDTSLSVPKSLRIMIPIVKTYPYCLT